MNMYKYMNRYCCVASLYTLLFDRMGGLFVIWYL